MDLMLDVLEEKISYTFKNKNYINEALTHSSYAHEKKDVRCNERMEFLGDAVLGIIVSDYLFSNYSDKAEGELSKTRASLVCEQALSSYAKEISLGEFLVLGRGERRSGGSKRPSIIADAFEALIAAIYLDSGIEEARKFVLPFVIRGLEKPGHEPFKDYKTTLQEIVQQNEGEKLEYVLIEESGPDHNKHFVYEVRLNSNVIGKGGGKNKKEAEQQAAREALSLMGY